MAKKTKQVEAVAETEELMEPVKETEFEPAVIVNCEKVNFRKTMGGDVITTLSAGVEVDAKLTEDPNWLEVRAGHEVGYIMTKYVQFVEE